MNEETPHNFQKGESQERGGDTKGLRHIEPQLLLEALKPTPSKPPTPDPVSRYEGDLAEFPLVPLGKRGKRDLTIFTYEDTITGKNGAPVTRRWAITPHPKWGFGTERIRSTLLDLIQVWYDDNFSSDRIHFGSVYKLLKSRGATTEGSKEYQRVVFDLEALAHLQYDVDNALWDDEKQAYVSLHGFKLFDHAAIFTSNPIRKGSDAIQHALPFSYIKATSLMHAIAKKNPLILPIAPSFFHDLTPTEQQLALHLTRAAWKYPAPKPYRRNFLTFARQIGITATQPKKVKQLLKRNLDSLIRKTFPVLRSYVWEAADRAGENISFSLRRLTKDDPLTKESAFLRMKRRLLITDLEQKLDDYRSRPFYKWSATNLDPELLRAMAAQVSIDIRTDKAWRGTKGQLFWTKVRDYCHTHKRPFPYERKRRPTPAATPFATASEQEKPSETQPQEPNLS